MGVIIDGKAIAVAIKNDIKQRLDVIKLKTKLEPCLAVVLVGEDPASAIYVSSKAKACGEIGFKTLPLIKPSNITQQELEDLILSLNKDKSVHGILVQLPLPSQINKDKIIELIDPLKDVDGFHHENAGKLFCGDVENSLFPCTPSGCMYVINQYLGSIAGKNVCIVGASNIVGKPMALMCINAGATVSVCNKKTKNLEYFTKEADVIIVAAGKPNLIKPEIVKDGVFIVDVGINRLENGKIVGDCDFEGLKSKASFITPVPGGIGPLTIAFLLENTFKAFCRSLNGSE